MFKVFQIGCVISASNLGIACCQNCKHYEHAVDVCNSPNKPFLILSSGSCHIINHMILF